MDLKIWRFKSLFWRIPFREVSLCYCTYSDMSHRRFSKLAIQANYLKNKDRLIFLGLVPIVNPLPYQVIKFKCSAFVIKNKVIQP